MRDTLQFIVYAGCLSVLFLPLVVSDDMFFPFITGKNFWFRIIVEITFSAWLLLTLYDDRYKLRFSWLLASVGSFLAVMLVANTLAEYPLKSFWSNFERMDGYVTLVHFAVYFIVLGSVFHTKEIDVLGIKTTPWHIFMVTALGAAIAVSFTAFQQLSGTTVTTMGWRINGTLGNAAYMAIYMLFNVFVAAWVLIHSKNRIVQGISVLLLGMFVFLLLQTATRGTIVGLAAGSMFATLYIAIYNTQYPQVRKVAAGIFVSVAVLAGLLFAFQDSAFVTENRILNRASNINLAALDLRITIWQLGLEGISERPILGWGQGNFNYIFNQFYNPNLAGRAELWYDRGHNMFIDWLSAGGILGLVTYLSIYAALAYYLLVQPIIGRAKPAFTVTENGLLVGIVSGYFIHNLVVFDNIVSYIFFAVVLAVIHSRVSTSLPALTTRPMSPVVRSQIAVPLVVLITGAVIYAVNIPNMQAARDIIDAYKAPTASGKQAEMEEAFSRNSFAQQELTEQYVQLALQASNNRNTSPEERQAFINGAERRLQDLIASKPTDARVYVFAMSFYRSLGMFDRARGYGKLARQYSPQKPAIILEQGLVEYQAGDIDAMMAFFSEAYELEPLNENAQITYGAGIILTGGTRADLDAVLDEAYWGSFATDRFAIVAAEQAQNYELLADMQAYQVETRPDRPQTWIGLAVAQYRGGDVAAAIATLEDAIVAVPQIKTSAQCFITAMEQGEDPVQSCQ